MLALYTILVPLNSVFFSAECSAGPILQKELALPLSVLLGSVVSILLRAHCMEPGLRAAGVFSHVI